jgi:SOS response regulatory protein OraA/RecX
MRWTDNFDQRRKTLNQEKTISEYALERATKLLARQSYTRQGLYQKLLRDGFPAQPVIEAIDRMDEIGALDDEAYGRTLIQKCTRKGYGPIRIEAELYRSGIDRDLRQTMMEELPNELEMVLSYLDRVCMPEDLTDETYYQNLSRRLSRRGYHWSVINEGMDRYKR